MKTSHFRLLTVFFAVVMFIAFSLNIYAAQSNAVTQNGLTAQLFTDKDSYKAGESVKASVQVENHTGEEVYIFTQINVPEGVKLAGNKTAFDTVLQDGESWNIADGITQNSGGISSTVGSSPQTGDNMQAGFYVILAILAVVGILALLVYGKNCKALISVMLCMAMVAGMVVSAVPAHAEAMNGEILLGCTIQIDGKDTELTAKVSYVIYEEAEEAVDESMVVPTETPTEAPTVEPTAVPTAEPTAPPEETGSEKGDEITAASAPVETTSADGIKIYKTKEGAVIIAAEELVLDETQIKVVDNAAAVGGKAVKTIQYNNASGYLPNVETDNPSMAFGILPDQTGSYYIWARIVAKDASDDSIWMSKDGAAYKDTALVLSPWSEDEEDFQWKRIGTVTAEKDDTVIIRFIPRDKDALFDRFILTTNALYTPTEGGQSPTADMEIVELPSDVYNIPEIKPTVGEHPRVMFRVSDIPTIKDYMDEAENANALAEYNALLAEEFDGNLPAGSGNYNGEKLAIIEAKAFDYAINGNEENGKAAVAAIKNYITTNRTIPFYNNFRLLATTNFDSFI